MQQNIDLIDLLRALNAEGTKYLIVGAYWVGLRKCRENMAGAAAFGAPLEDLKVSDLASPGTFFIMGRPPNQIDLITAIDGVSFEQAWSTKIEATYGGVPVSYIGRDELIANKKAAARPQDLADVSYLESAKDRQE